MTSSTSKKVNKPDNTKKEKERELGLEIAQLKLRIQERDQTIFDLEEQIRGKDAIIVDKCQIIERLEQSHFERLSPDQDSLEETSEISQNTIRCMNVNESDVLKTKEEAHLLEELEEERRCRLKFMEQNELLLQQWDDALVYVEQVQKMLQAELKHTSTLIDENATLRKRINETVIISKNHIQFVAILLVLLSLYLYTLS
ncbi:Cortactin-binding protein [Dirofilaria immitis]